MQSVRSRIWTRVAVSISYDNNHYTTDTSREYNNNDEHNSPITEKDKNHQASSQKFRQLVMVEFSHGDSPFFQDKTSYCSVGDDSSSSSSSSSCAASTDFSDTVSPFGPIIHRSWQVFQTTSCVCTELIQIRSWWSAKAGTSICWDLLNKVDYDFVLTSPAVLQAISNKS